MNDTALIPMADVEKLARSVATSRLFKGFDTPEKALVLMMVAQSEGCHPMQAVQRYDVIDGKPAKKTDAMLADFQQRGGKVTWSQLDDKAVEGIFEAPGLGKPVTVRWTIEMAARAGLAKKNTWQSYPRAMMRARVVSEGIRTAMPGVVAGLYTPEEVQDFDAAPLTGGNGTTPQPQPERRGQVIDATVVEPEATKEKPKAPDAKATKEQITALCAVMTKLGIKERPAVLAWINERIAPRAVESRLDLTPDEATKCIEAADAQLNPKAAE